MKPTIDINIRNYDPNRDGPVLSRCKKCGELTWSYRFLPSRQKTDLSPTERSNDRFAY